MKRITLTTALLLSLSACAATDFVTGMTPEQIQAYPEVYQQRLAEAYGRTYVPQPVTMPNYQYTPLGVQAQTPVFGANRTYSTAYCRELASDMITCKQIR